MKKLSGLQLRILIIWIQLIAFSITVNAQEPIKLTFDGSLSEHKLLLKDLNPALPSDWSDYTHLVMEMKTTSPQRFSIWLYRTNGTPVRVMFHPFGQNVWLRAHCLCSTFVVRTNSE
jgi:hypothetical protein